MGVGDALGADVIRINGSGACAGAGLPQDEIRTAIKAVNAKRLDVFIYVLNFKWEMTRYGVAVGVGNAVGLAVWVGIGVKVGGTEVCVGMNVAVNGRNVSVSGSVR